mmetsp:Transcript_94725/g.138308  ORF Transcript_94725/g.138308 Transcript_94725/m.138308 type:complete len:142 (+) Transcript_94725:409-834(+)
MASEGAQVDLREYGVLIVGDALKERLAQRTCTYHVNYLCYLLSIRTLVRTDVCNFDCVYVNCCTGAYVCMYVCMYVQKYYTCVTKHMSTATIAFIMSAGLQHISFQLCVHVCVCICVLEFMFVRVGFLGQAETTDRGPLRR